MLDTCFKSMQVWIWFHKNDTDDPDINETIVIHPLDIRVCLCSNMIERK